MTSALAIQAITQIASSYHRRLLLVDNRSFIHASPTRVFLLHLFGRHRRVKYRLLANVPSQMLLPVLYPLTLMSFHSLTHSIGVLMVTPLYRRTLINLNFKVIQCSGYRFYHNIIVVETVQHDVGSSSSFTRFGSSYTFVNRLPPHSYTLDEHLLRILTSGLALPVGPT